MTQTLTVRHTGNSTRFHMLPSINRPVTNGRVDRMRQSLVAMGCIRPIVVAKASFPTGVELEYIVDGQSLYQALIGLGWQIPYVTINVNNDPAIMISHMAMLNATSVKWALADYVHAWKFYKQPYRDLEQYSQRYGIKYAGIVALAMNIEEINESAPIIKNGTFEITNARFHDLVGIAFDLLMTEELRDVQRLPNFFAAELVRYYNNIEVYNHEVIKQRIVENIDIIRATASSSVKLVLREKIFIIRTSDGE